MRKTVLCILCENKGVDQQLLRGNGASEQLICFLSSNMQKINIMFSLDAAHLNSLTLAQALPAICMHDVDVICVFFRKSYLWLVGIETWSCGVQTCCNNNKLYLWAVQNY